MTGFSRTAFATLPLLFALVGCSSEGAGLYEVSGEVTFQDRPLDNGSIQFHPHDPSQCNFGGAVISNGKYSVAKLRGLKPGTYKITISAGDAQAPEKPVDAPGEARPVAKERIPADWNVNSTRTIEVTAGKNQFDFHIR